MTEIQQKVYNILLCPILCIKDFYDIQVLKDTNGKNIIVSGQKYISNTADEDMSDFSISFYEIIYEELLSSNNLKGILNSNGELNSKEFAGDTINSFNSIANVGLKENWKLNVPSNEWPYYLSAYHKQYHCLANFWLIPMRHGRMNSKFSKYDSCNFYLYKILKEYKKFQKEKKISYNKQKFKNYFQSIKSEDFLKIHHIQFEYDKNFGESGLEYLKYYKEINENNCKFLIAEAENMIKSRAKMIVDDTELCDKLYTHFNKLEIIKYFD